MILPRQVDTPLSARPIVEIDIDRVSLVESSRHSTATDLILSKGEPVTEPPAQPISGISLEKEL
jgi:hypothetical protein